MPDAPVILDRDGAVATVTINRPEAHNALNLDVKEALVSALDDTAADTEVRAVILTGAGASFCVGQDLGEHADALNGGADAAFDTVDRHYAPIIRSLATMPKPVIAAVNGTCVGAGLGFALACDVRVISASATLSTAFTAIGLTCDSGLSLTLARAVGEVRARELVLRGSSFSATEAVQWGISADIVDAHDVPESARALADRLAAGPTRAYAEVKTAIADSQTMCLSDVLAAEAAAQKRAGATRDHQAAVRAFLAKEKPQFEGR